MGRNFNKKLTNFFFLPSRSLTLVLSVVSSLAITSVRPVVSMTMRTRVSSTVMGVACAGLVGGATSSTAPSVVCVCLTQCWTTTPAGSLLPRTTAPSALRYTSCYDIHVCMYNIMIVQIIKFIHICVDSG